MSAPATASLETFRNEIVQGFSERYSGKAPDEKLESLRGQLKWQNKQGKWRSEEDFKALFSADFATKDEAARDALTHLLSNSSKEDLCRINGICALGCFATPDHAITGDNPAKTQEQLESLVGEKFDGFLLLQDGVSQTRVGLQSEAQPFALHSIGKIFTGIAVCTAIAQGAIPPELLHKKGLELDEDVLKQLPPEVAARCAEVTLHQTMTHRAGFDDYLGGCFDAIEGSLKAGEAPEILVEPQDFLKHVSDKTHPIGEFNYSNTGILLVGLALQHQMNEASGEHKLYSQILRDLVLDPAGIAVFSAAPIPGSITTPHNEVAAHLCGSPAGGYFTSAADMQRFGEHLCKRWQDPAFRAAVAEYGQEFYQKDHATISHSGGVWGSTTWFSAHLPSGITCVAASNCGGAAAFGEHVCDMVSDEQKSAAASIDLAPSRVAVGDFTAAVLAKEEAAKTTSAVRT